MNLNLSVTGCAAQNVNVHLITKKNIHPCPRYNEKSTFTAALRISKSYCLKLDLNLDMFTQLHRHMPSDW